MRSGFLKLSSNLHILLTCNPTHMIDSKNLFLFRRFYFGMCMCVSYACMFEYQLHLWFSQWTKEGIGFPKMEVQKVMLGNKEDSSARERS